MVPDLFNHPLLQKDFDPNHFQNVDDALQNKRNVIGIICEPGGTGYSFHAATLFKKENDFYILKNSYPTTPFIKIPIKKMPFDRKILE